MKRNDKIKILVLMGIIFVFFTWIVAAGSFSEGTFISSGIFRAGIFDYLLVLYYAFSYKASELFYLLVLGGTYGVLSNTKGYRKLVDKTVSLIKGKEIIALLVVTLIMGLYVSITNEILSILCVVPFVLTVFLKRGQDRLTAISAAFGGIFIGMFGQTFGTYGISQLNSLTTMTVADGIWFKVIMFVMSYALFNLFAILHIKKRDKLVNATKYDLYCTEKLDEKDVKKNKKQKAWPTMTLLIVAFIVTILGFINWQDSFGVTVFSDIMTKLENVTISDIPIVTSLLGSMDSFGNWNLLALSFVLIVTTILVAIVNKVSLNDIIDNFASGMKKISKVAVTYVLVMSIFILSYYFAWPTTLINYIIGNGNFNIFTLLIAAIIAAVLLVDPEYIGYTLGTFVAVAFADNILASNLLIHFGYSIALVIGPTSIILMIALSYLDVPYSKWIKYIWKFVLSILLVGIIAFAIMCYM